VRWGRYSTVLFAAAALAVALALHFSRGPDAAGSGLGPARRFLLGMPTDVDSWRVMQAAFEQTRQNPKERLYRKVFYEQRRKYLYAPTALLFYAPFAPAGGLAEPSDASPALRVLCWLAVMGSIVFAWATFDTGSGFSPRAALAEGRGGEVAARFLAFAVLGLAFYPLMKAYGLGQIQMWVNCALVGAILAWVKGRAALAGALTGITALIKPQYSLLVLWGAWRRDWRFFIGALCTLIPGLLLSLWMFGLQNHVDYLDVLSFLSRHGEAYFFNQSINGALNRLLGNGDWRVFSAESYPPFNRIVYLGTLASSAVLVGTAFFASRPSAVRAERPGDATAFCIMILSATMASPLAWEHHYGVTFGIFAWAFARALRADAPPALLAFLCASYLLMGNYIDQARSVPAGWATLLQSYVLAGALVALVCLHLLRPRPSSAPP